MNAGANANSGMFRDLLRKAPLAGFEGLEVDSKVSMTPPARPSGDRDVARGLTPIAALILRVDARAIGRDESEEAAAKEAGRKRLAMTLGCTADSLQDIVDSYGESWQEFVLEEKVQIQIESTESRDISWDRLEQATLKKLVMLVEQDRVSDVGSLVAIAKVSNTANRGDRTRNGHSHGNGGGINIMNQQNNTFLPGNPEAGVLPSGDLGRINLNLAPRFIKQIEGQIVEQKERVIDSVDMLTVKEIQAAGEAFEKEEER